MLSLTAQQQNLQRIEYKYYTGVIDGITGPLTERAIRDFQADHALSSDGIWGEKTNAASISACSAVQSLLNSRGFSLDVDGIAGNMTFSAIKEFQSRNGLYVDGIAGQNTIAALKSASPPLSKGKKVMLDPGHGGRDPGASALGFKEKDLNLSIALHCKAFLEKAGISVGMTREADIYIGLMDRCYKENAYAPDVFVSIHNNAGGGDGSEFIYISDKGYELSKTIKPYIDSLGQNFRRYIKRDDAVVTYTKAPACIVECAFVDNSLDVKIVSSEEGRRAMGEAIAGGVIQFLG